MPLQIEVLDYFSKRWLRLPVISPKDRAGSFSDTMGNQRQVYHFECDKSDGSSRIYRSKGGFDFKAGEGRVISSESFELIRELKRGEIYVMQIQPDNNPNQVKVRFTHI
jgi:hypothetical protein